MGQGSELAIPNVLTERQRAVFAMNPIVVDRKDGNSTLDRFWEEGGDIFYQGLGRAKGANIDDSTRLEDTIETLKLSKSLLSKEYGKYTLQVGAKDLDIKIGRIIKRLELRLQFGDAATQFGPETVSLAWLAFRMVFTVCLSILMLRPLHADITVSSFRGFSKILRCAILSSLPWM